MGTTLIIMAAGNSSRYGSLKEKEMEDYINSLFQS